MNSSDTEIISSCADIYKVNLRCELWFAGKKGLNEVKFL